MKKLLFSFIIALGLPTITFATEPLLPLLSQHPSHPQENIQLIKKNILDFPATPGRYRVGVDYLHSLIPFYADFDGKKWSGDGYNKVMTFSKGDYSKINYYLIIKK